jgi:predicted ATPase
MSIKRLTLKKLLSFNDTAIDLGTLNVLIGPNAVGKSNLIEAISLLQAAPANIAGQILRGGGIRQWLWLGDRVPSPIGAIECELVVSRGRQFGPLLYRLQFSEDANGFLILSEDLAKADSGPAAEVYFERPMANRVKFGPMPLEWAAVQSEGLVSIPHTQSVLSQFKNPADPTPITEVGNHFEQIRIFREFRTGPTSQARYGISTAAPKDGLSEGADNLALVLHELDFLGVHDRITRYLKRFCERFEDVKVSVGEALARMFLREAGLSEMLSAIRVSDGTLKFLCLLAVLFHPKPAPLICLEEPEVGLHPDALRIVAEALVEASGYTQLIVTTHSEALVDALSDLPDAVLVCERDFDNGTQFKRLSHDELDAWLEHYTLGELWRKGEIGGGRW